MSDFSRFNRKEPLIFRLVPWFIGFVCLAIITYWIIVGIIAIFAVGEISKLDFSNGIKPVIEKVWCGEAGCMNDNK